MVADRHRLAAYHNKHCWRAFRGYQHRWPLTTLNAKNMGFKWIFRFCKLWRTLRVNFRWNILEIDQDNLRTKLNWCCRDVPWALAQISCYQMTSSLRRSSSADVDKFCFMRINCNFVTMVGLTNDETPRFRKNDEHFLNIMSTPKTVIINSKC